MRKTQEEIDNMSPAELKAYLNQQDILVHGDDAPKGHNGMRIEQGIGSALQPTRNHVEALRNSIRAGYVKDPDGKVIEKAEKELAAYEANRRGRPVDNDGDRDTPALSADRAAPKHRGNPAGLVKARAAAKAKREAAAAQAGS